MVWLVALLLGFVALHAFMSMRYNYDWIGTTVKKMLLPVRERSVVDLYPIPTAPYMDRMGSYTRIPKMKENVRS
jgi:bacteriorhodopsin